jgi:L-alanine-DL-glutamate epimerase-like enolase superfamily enzyme
MIVTRIRTRVVDVPLDRPFRASIFDIRSYSAVLVFVETDAGLVGEGMIATFNGAWLANFVQLVETMAPLLIGKDADNIGAIWQSGWHSIRFFGQAGLPVFVMSAFDCALWDIKGKSLGRSVHSLLGTCRRELPVYESNGLCLAMSTRELQEGARRTVERGLRALKMRLGHAQDVERVRAVREAIGPDISLMVDANQILSVSDAIRLGHLLEPLDIGWFEEPVDANDVRGTAEVGAAISIPIAGGESGYALTGLRPLIEQRAVRVLMPDLQRAGGITEFLRIGQFAHGHDIPISSHVFPHYSLQALAVLPNVHSLELLTWHAALFQHEIELREGRAVVPDRPGLGFPFSPDAIEHFAF